MKAKILEAMIDILKIELEANQRGWTTEFSKGLSDCRYHSVEILLDLLKHENNYQPPAR